MTNCTKLTPRYRTIKECHEELLRIDESCKITVYCIRTLCKKHLIDYIPSGSKIIVNLDNLLAYLGMSNQPTLTGIRSTIQTSHTQYKQCLELGNIACDRL